MKNQLMRRWLYISTGFLGLTALGIAGVEYLGQTRVDPLVNEYREVQKRHLILFAEDQEFLSRVPLFEQPTAPTKDAGPFLNPRVPWAPQPEKEHFADRLPADLSEEVIRHKNDWMRHHTRILRNRNINLSWFSELARFDYWDVESNSPQGDLLKEERFVSPEQLPIPDAIELLTLTKLRLAVGAAEKKPLQALQETRQLAQLLLTTENIHLYTTALSILDIERRALQYFLDTDMIKESDWEPVARNITRRAARALWAARGYFHFWTDIKVLEEVFLSPRPPVGLCAALNEAAPRELSLRPMFARRLPLERDLRPSLEKIDEIMERADEICRFKYLKAMRENNLLQYDPIVPRFLTKLPYSRKIFGLRIATVPFIGFEAYNDPKHHD